VRLWTLHPKYLDAKGLVALWREALLAQAVLRNKTRGYRHHPQLVRFRDHPRPAAAIAMYLVHVLEEAQARGYHFDATRIGRRVRCDRIKETRGQLDRERDHLGRKLRNRDPARLLALARVRVPEAHPLFIIGRGRVRDWERAPVKKPRRQVSSTARPSPRPLRRSPS
jgi:hypothetical protein